MSDWKILRRPFKSYRLKNSGLWRRGLRITSRKRWDGEIEQDLKSGRLDKLIKSALNDIKDGEFKDI